MDLPVIQKPDGTKEFVGKEDPTNPITVPHDATVRYCKRCRKNYTNDMEFCPQGHAFDDAKMECPVCHKWFDYLLGETSNGGQMGCEVDWKPPIKPEGRNDGPATGEVFD